MHRRVVLASLLFAASATARAQGANHEYRPELVLTLPRVQGYGLQILFESHIETEDLKEAERIAGVGIVSPTLYEPLSVRFAVEGRQVSSPTVVEHRYIPTMFSAVPIGQFELRNRTRVELRDIDRAWSARWQDRSAFGREFHAAGRTAYTYGQVDVSYDTRFHTINRLEKTAGSRIGITPGSSIDLFLTKQDDSRRAVSTLYIYGAILRVAM